MQVGNLNDNFFNNNISRGRGRGMRRGGRAFRGNNKKFRGNNRVNNFNNGPDSVPKNNPPPHYEDNPNWTFQPQEDPNIVHQQVNKNQKPLIVNEGIPNLGTSFVKEDPSAANFQVTIPSNVNGAPPATVQNGKTEIAEATGGQQPDENQAAWSLLQEYWTFVQENPYNFDGWILLLNHVESMKHIEAARSAFEGFLPLYPYCFAYWKKLADIEGKYTSLPKSIGVLIYGTRSIPLCHEIWTALLSSFKTYCVKENLSLDLVRMLYRTGLEKIGMSWNSSPFWEACIKFETEHGNYLKVMTLYKWLISIPVKLYNKHWDTLVVLIRDEHPQKLLSADIFDHYHKLCCDQLKVKYTQLEYNTENPPKLDKQVGMLIREKILATLIKIHENNVKQAEKRWKLEEKIKRPYFHVKPLEKRQLKAWNDLIDFEIKEGDPVKIMLLFERCLVACAQYEEMWCKYATFLEEHALNIANGKYKEILYRPMIFSGDKDTENVYKADWFDFYYDVSDDTKAKAAEAIENLSEGVGVGSRVLTCPILTPQWILHGVTYEDVRQVYRRASWIHCPSKPLILMQWAEFEESQGDVQTARELLNTVLSKHPLILKARMQLIELERRNNNLARVEELFSEAFTTFTEIKEKSFIAIRFARFLFKVKGEFDTPLAILRKALKKDKGNVFLYNQVFGICYEKQPVDCDGVLAAVMLALASKELNLEQKYEFCVQRKEFLKEHGTIQQIKKSDIELRGIKAELDKERKEIEMLENEKKKKEEELKAEEKKAQEEADLMELGELPDMEPSDIHPSRDDKSDYTPSKRSEGRSRNSKDRDSRKRRHRSKSPKKSHRKKRRESKREDRLSKSRDYEDYMAAPKSGFDNGDPAIAREMPLLDAPAMETKISDFINVASMESNFRKPEVDTDINSMPPERNMGGMFHHGPPPHIRPQFPPEMPNKNVGIVPPHVNNMRPPLINNPPIVNPRHSNEPVPLMNLQIDDPKNMEKKPLISQPPPLMGDNPNFGGKNHGPIGQVNGMHNGPPPAGVRPPLINGGPRMGLPNTRPGGPRQGAPARLMRPPMNRPQSVVNPNIMAPSNVNLNSPVINVPDWLVTEGGELRLSQGPNGNSILKYWPKFMNEKGHNTLFGSLSKSIKWFNRQAVTGNGQMAELPMRLAWLGPCDFSKDGYTLEKDNSWPPEIIDLLHILTKVCDMTTQFNSCLLRLLRNGQDHQPWDSEEHPALNKNPRIAIVSLGAIRSFEMKHKNGPEFIRFPLLPGSLLFFEGATQSDWIQRITEDPLVQGERISMSFRTMLMINGITV